MSGGTIWHFLNWKTFATLQKSVYDIGLKFNSILVWEKEGALGLESARLRPCYELCALILANGAKIKNRSLNDLWRIKYKSNKEYHPAEKPLELLKRIIKETDGDLILDPFMGSGTTGVACIETGRKFIGIEINERYFDIACKRIENAMREKAGELALDADAG